MASSSSVSLDRQAGPVPWRLSQVVWRDVGRQQDWGSVVGSVVAIVVLAIVGAVRSLNTAPFSVTDSSIAYPDLPTTVPYWVACLVPSLCLLASVAIGELVVARGLHTSATNAASVALFFVIDGAAAWAVATCLTVVLKLAIGRLRPDFLARCMPEAPSEAPAPAWGRDAGSNPACTAPGSTHLTDGHFSYPSGHTSTVFVLATYSCTYCVWAFWGRVQRYCTRRGWPKAGVASRLARDGGSAVALLWTLWQLCFAWGVGSSRILDYKHHVGDVVAGALLGTMCGALYAGRAILCHRCVVAEPEPEEDGSRVLLEGGGSGGGRGGGSSAPV